MTFNRPRPGSIFSARALPLQPQTFPAVGDPPAVAASPRPCDAADALSPQEDLPGATHSDSSLPFDPTATGRRADIVRLSDVAPRPVEWLWQDRLASGTLSMLSGDPGVGKTWIALAIAAALSRGQHPQNGSRSQYSLDVAAQRDGVSIATLRRSKFDLGVKGAKDGKSGAWYWTLPPAEEDQQACQAAT